MSSVTLGGKLVEQGYDVWLGNSRGATYSDKHVNDDVWTLEEKWDFSWATMGQYDIPAVVDEILRLSGSEKVTYVGYS